MATFGPIASSVPNVLFDAAKVDRDVQAFQRNQLLMDNSRQDQQYQNFDRDRQEVARASAALLSLPPDQRPQAYAATVQQLQAQGFARRAPQQYPGDQQIEALARQGMSATEQFGLVEKRRSSEALMGALGLGGGAAAPMMGATPASMSVPVPGAPAAAPAGPAGGQEPRGIRNNNPLNLSFAGQPGASMEQHATPRFARFETPEAGIAASVNQLRLYQQRGNNTLAGMINTWAPPSENDTRGYVQQVAAATGLRPDQPVNLDDPAVVARLVGAMAQVETGRRIDPSVIERAVQTGGGRAAPSEPEVTRVSDGGRPASQPPAAPAVARPALPPVDPRSGLTAQQAALATAAASTNPSSALAMVSQFRQQNQMAAERAADDVRTQQQQAESNRRADEAARRAEEAGRRADEAATRQARAAELQASRAGVPPGYEPDPTNAGVLRPIPGGPAERAERDAEEKRRRDADPAAAATEAERKAAGFLERMEGAEAIVGRIAAPATRGGEGYNPGNLQDRVAASTPLIGNFLSTEQGQRYMNAAAEWARAKLRLESGAVIGDSEAREEARTYFPMPGDSPAVIAQKEQLRATARQGVRVQAGRAAGRRPDDAAGAEGGGQGGQAVPPPVPSPAREALNRAEAIANAPPGQLPALPPGFQVVR